MIPLVLVTGFLGSGKTTFLQKAARRSESRDLVFLVNEFADLNIDARRVEGIGPAVFEVTGGSLFCECKVSDFIANLEAIHRYFSDGHRNLRGVMIETSGIADPEVMAKLLKETGMSDRYVIARILALVAPYRFRQYLDAFPNLVAQIRTSDWVLLNKTDLASEEELAEVERLVHSIKPGARILRTRYAEIELDLWSEPGTYEEGGALSECANPYACIIVEPRADLTVQELNNACAGHPERILRLKGVVGANGSRTEIDFCQGVFSSHEAASKEPSRLVLIVGEEDEEWAIAWKKDLETPRL